MFPFSSLIDTALAGPTGISMPGSAIVVNDSGISPGTVIAGVEFERGGAIQKFTSAGPGFSYSNNWMAASGRNASVGDAFEVKFEQISGDALDSGVLSVWQQLNTLRSISYNRSTTFVNLSGVFTAEVREIALPSNTTGTGTISLTAFQEP